MCRHNAYFVDLFVRVTNAAAIGMYKSVSVSFGKSRENAQEKIIEQPFFLLFFLLSLQFGYSVYRTVLGYYSNKENAYGKILLHSLLFCLSAFSK